MAPCGQLLDLEASGTLAKVPKVHGLHSPLRLLDEVSICQLLCLTGRYLF